MDNNTSAHQELSHIGNAAASTEAATTVVTISTQPASPAAAAMNNKIVYSAPSSPAADTESASAPPAPRQSSSSPPTVDARASPPPMLRTTSENNEGGGTGSAARPLGGVVATTTAASSPASGGGIMVTRYYSYNRTLTTATVAAASGAYAHPANASAQSTSSTTPTAMRRGRRITSAALPFYANIHHSQTNNGIMTTTAGGLAVPMIALATSGGNLPRVLIDRAIVNSTAAAGAAANTTNTQHQQQQQQQQQQPKQKYIDLLLLEKIRNVLNRPDTHGRASCGARTMHLDGFPLPVNILKGRYLLGSEPCPISVSAAARTPASYRHLIDLNSSNLRCTDVYTEKTYLCKIVNEPLYKVQRAYFNLLQAEGDTNRSSLYGHHLIRGVHDIVPQTKQRTYVIISPYTDADAVGKGGSVDAVFEDLHTYIRNKRRVGEDEARALFHQICETVQVCHRNGIILRDLKLKRFYFIDEERTKLQYESLEGCMILDDPNDDTLSDKIGCPLYTAPELLCPKPTYKGKPADIWSLGVILYTMLVGQYPFYEKVNCNLITIIRHCHVQIPSSLSRPVRWLLLLLLRKKYEERIKAEDILYIPWVRQQRPPYMSIPYDIVLDSDNEDDDTPTTAHTDDDALLRSERQTNAMAEDVVQNIATVTASTSSSSSNAYTSTEQQHGEEEQQCDEVMPVAADMTAAVDHNYAITNGVPIVTADSRPLDYRRVTLQQQQHQQQQIENVDEAMA